MKKKIRLRVIEYIFLLSIFTLAINGCAGESGKNAVRKFSHSMSNPKSLGDTESEAPEDLEDYLIVEINSADETMRVYRYENGLEYQYYYGLTTRFLNKYGDYTSVANFQVGDVINISETDLSGRVTEVRKADDVWIYDDVSRFELNEDMLQIADAKYIINEDTYIFSEGKEASITEITNQDKLSVVGVDKKILSITVTTGHGVLELTNTELFEGSYIQLGRGIFAIITEDMVMNVPEGTYTLVVANNGWGGSKEIQIERGGTTVVNLDEIKGEGPKYGEILFKVDVDEAQIYIDNELIDISEVVKLTYGAHAFEIKAEGYNKWKKTLYVNSPEATIEVVLDDEGINNKSETSSETNVNESETKDSETDNKEKDESDSSENSSENTEKTEKTSSDSLKEAISNLRDGSSLSSGDLTDYLSTLSTLLDSL